MVAAPAKTEASSFFVGQRVKDHVDFRGTVRYVGPVVTSKKDPGATWVGIEWDDETRGKHDGSVVDEATGASKRYFSCGATAGSFLKPSKVDGGSTLAAALRDKYVAMDAPLLAPEGKFEHRANTKRGATKAIEFCGELKVRAEQQLGEGHVDRATLRCCGIRGLGDVSEEADAAHLARLTVLDLQCNLLNSWADVAKICASAPNLTSLDVSGNLLGPFPGGGFQDDVAGALGNLTALSANGVGLDAWAQVLALGAACPRLRTLHVARNAVCGRLATDAGDLAAVFADLELLDVAHTGLADAAPLRALPKLAELHANENPGLRSLGRRSSEIPTAPFRALGALAVSGCGFADWAAVDALSAACPELRRLRFGRDNAVTAKLGQSEARALLVARVPALTHLNGADVGPKERREAEKRYVRVACAELASGAAKPEDHPRLDALKAAHGDPAVSAHGAKADSSTLAANLLEVTLRCAAAEQCHLPPVTKKFPAATKVALLKRVAPKLFKLPPDMAVVLYFKAPGDDWPTVLDDDSATLGYFGVPDGATIDVNEKVDDENDAAAQ